MSFSETAKNVSRASEVLKDRVWKEPCVERRCREPVEPLRDMGTKKQQGVGVRSSAHHMEKVD